MKYSDNHVAMHVGQSLIITIKRIGINGEGIGYYKKKVVFVEGGLPDEVVIVEITKVERNLAYGKIVRIKERSPLRVKPACPVYQECGGCQLQHYEYQGQLQAKREIVVEAFQRYYRTDKQPFIRKTVGAESLWKYRNKAQLQVGKRNHKVIAGLYSQGSHEIVDITNCPIQHPMTNEIVKAACEVLQELRIPIYDERTQEGAVRTLVARVGFATKEAQLTIVTVTDSLPHKEAIVPRLREKLPYLKSIMQNINPQRTPLVFGNRTVKLWGADTIHEELRSAKFLLSPTSFFQLNPYQTVKLYDFVKEACALTGKEKIVDAYCGVGTIGMWLAPYAKEIRGIEIIPEAVKSAEQNAKQSGINNVRFYAGKVEELLPKWYREGYKADVVVVDPPRTGCDEELLKALVKAKPQKIVYVSCNPSTLAKDCDILKKDYKIEWVQPVDMFAMTSHVENVCLLYKVK